MARLTAEIMNGQRVIFVETEDEFFHYLGQVPLACPPGLVERIGVFDELSPEEWEEELKGEREWEELQKVWNEEDQLGKPPMDPSSPFSQWGGPAASAVVIPFPARMG